ncbi:hypothetical protein Xen7305DRAFT_00039540, partial [Xenococcus sp. PCC 7305]
MFVWVAGIGVANLIIPTTGLKQSFSLSISAFSL